MQQRDQNPVQPVGICGRLYSFITSIFMVRRLANSFPDTSSSSSEESESDVEFWEAEDSTTSDDCNETDQIEANTNSDTFKGARQGALHKGKEKMSQIEANNNRRELQQVQELGMYDGISLSLVPEKTNYRRSSTKYPLSYANGARTREATKLEMEGSPEMMRRQCKNTQIPKERSQEVGVKNRKARIISRVFTNINEKSDAFIRSRKEAMRRSYNVGSKTL